MREVGRNDPCPCGSGRKYKQCCLARGDRERAHDPIATFGNALRTALDWLHSRHRRALDAALGGVRSLVVRAAGGQQLPEEHEDTLLHAELEHVLAESELVVPKGRATAWELLRGTGGPLLAVEELEVIRELTSRPLRPWIVAAVAPGQGLELVDAVDETRVTVVERSGSQMLQPGDVVAGRVLRRSGGWTFSGAVLPFPRAELQGLRERVRAAAAGRASDDPDTRREVSTLLLESWVEMLARRSRPPRVIDARSGSPLLLATDHYRVVDRAALVARLAAQADVVGDAASGFSWVEPATHRVLAGVTFDGDRLELFARSLDAADAARAWFDSLAGGDAVHLTRELVDPWAALTEKRSRDAANPVRRESPGIALGPEDRQQITEHVYRDWVTTPIPALGDKSPRQAKRSKLGRERVVELISSYEHAERRAARDENRPPVDFAFLWRAVGIERPESP